MIGGSPIASRTITGHTMDFFPISIFLDDTVTLVDDLGEVAVEYSDTDVVTLEDTLTPPEVEATLTQVLSTRDYVVAVLNGELVEAWRKRDSTSLDETLWRRKDNQL